MCKEGLGGILTQEGHVIRYESQKLKEHENNYATHDLELAAIVHAMKMWRHYLMGRKFEPRTNHQRMKYLFDQPNLNAMQARWLELISEFDFDIIYVKGKENRVIDALIRRVHVALATGVSTCKSGLRDKMLRALGSDELYLQTKERLQQANVPEKYKDYQLDEDGILRLKGRVYIPDLGELRKSVLHEMHNVPYVGHPGYQKNLTAVRK